MSNNRLPQSKLSRKAFCIMDALVTIQDLCSSGLMEGGNVFATQEGIRWYLAERLVQEPVSEEEMREAIGALRDAGILES